MWFIQQTFTESLLWSRDYSRCQGYWDEMTKIPLSLQAGPCLPPAPPLSLLSWWRTWGLLPSKANLSVSSGSQPWPFFQRFSLLVFQPLHHPPIPSPFKQVPVFLIKKPQTNRKLPLEYHSHNGCRQDPPMDAKIIGWKFKAICILNVSHRPLSIY